jgi:hypothetical protein
VPKNQKDHPRAGSNPAIGYAVQHRAIDLQKDLFDAFLACRTTLEDLSDRTAALGQNLKSAVIAAHLTGKTAVSDAKHNALAEAINKRLGELSLPPVAPFKDTTRKQQSDPDNRPDSLAPG